MNKIQFPVELGYSLNRIDTAISSNPNTTERLQNARALFELVGMFSEEDFINAGLSHHLPERYKSDQSVNQRAEAFGESVQSRRPNAAYLIKDVLQGAVCEPENYIIGMLSFGQDNTMPRFRESGERVLSTWFHGSLAVKINPEKVVNGGIKIAKEAGLRALKLVRVTERQGKNWDLVVAEHHIKPTELGFKQIDEGVTVIEGEEYEGTVWRRDIS